MSTELEHVKTAVAEFDKVAAGIAALKKQYGGVLYDVRISKEMDAAKAARAAVREPRYEVERVRKAAKEPILRLGKELDARAKSITEELLAIESPIDDQIKSEEQRKEAEKQAKIDAELKRVSGIQDRISELRGNQSLSPTSGSGLIAEHISDLEGIDVDESFQEFRQQADDAKTAGITRLRDLHAAAVAHETEQARIKAEREELAKLRAAEEQRQAAERARIAEEERKAKAERDAEAARQAEELRREREALAVAQAEQDRVATAERAKLAEERAALDRQEAETMERNRMAMQEIQAIQHQTMIARTGRAGHVTGGTIEGVDKLIAETESWSIDEDRFGILAASAESVKQSTLADLKQYRIELVQRIKILADNKRKEDTKRSAYPGEKAIVLALVEHFEISESVVKKWLTELRKSAYAA